MPVTAAQEAVLAQIRKAESAIVRWTVLFVEWRIAQKNIALVFALEALPPSPPSTPPNSSH